MKNSKFADGQISCANNNTEDHTGHDHDNIHKEHDHEGHDHKPKNALSMAFWLNFFFSVIEVAGGLFTNSTAIIADAFHDFMDAGAIGIAIILEKVSGRKRSYKFSYGYKRFSLLSAIGLSTFLLVGAVLMIISAYNSFIHPKEVNSVGMLWLAVLGLAVNGFAFLRIKKGGEDAHGHSHGGGHSHNSRSIMLHLLEDVLGWAAVLVGAAVIYFTGWNWIDGVLAIGIALFVGYNAIKNLLDTANVLLQSVPSNVSIDELTKELESISGITGIHDMHLWSLDGNYNIGSLHVVLDKSGLLPGNGILNQVVAVMQKYSIHHPTVQVETHDQTCSLVDC